VYACSDEQLQGLDEYEGLSKGYYERRCIPVLLQRDNHSSGGAAWRRVDCDVYMLKASSKALAELARKQPLSEYSLSVHRTMYKPIRHIQVKQQLHLGEAVGSDSGH
jgi:hypothetical protein